MNTPRTTRKAHTVSSCSPQAAIRITGNTSTGSAAVLRQLNQKLPSSALDFDALMENNTFAGVVLTDSTCGTNTVYYNGSTHAALADALTAVYMSSPAGTAEEYCKGSADVGSLTHGHVADDLVSLRTLRFRTSPSRSTSTTNPPESRISRWAGASSKTAPCRLTPKRRKPSPARCRSGL